MPRRMQRPHKAHILIEGHQVDPASRWVFTVSLVSADGDRQTRWIGQSYERAILEAERRARMEDDGALPALQVRDHVVPEW